MPEVTIVGAGIAGLTAALRLLQRGFHVRLIEQDDFIGGKWGAHKHPDKPDYHEHCYHMFLNWFNNFWELADELNLRGNFETRDSLRYLNPGEFPHTTEMANVGSIGTFWKNMFSRVLPIPDMFIYNYSLVDLLAQPIHRGEFLDQYSVNAFMRSRLYATDEAAIHHQRTLAKAFACPSYLTSASTYKNFIKYGFRHPEPMMWVLRGNCYDAFHKHLEEKLRGFRERFRLELKSRVDRLHLDAAGKVDELAIARLDHSPTVHPDRPIKVVEREIVPVVGDLIVAIPPGAVGKLLDQDLVSAAPELGNVNKLRSEPMASVDLYFKSRLSHIPKEHVVLMNSRYELTFIDNGQLWPGEATTVLNVVASEFDPLVTLPGAESDFASRAGKPKTALDFILAELRRYLPFELDQIDEARTHIQTNTGEALFVNEVGSWQFRPGSTCRIPNLFLAGDYCRTVIDVVTIEGAMVSGLQAAEAVRRKRGVGTPIRIVEPDSYPELLLTGWSLLGAPYAYAAKLWASANDVAATVFGVRF
jgi:uncharacterized protein with NAD-binding domain and iron-sulfur cluster